VIDRLARAIAWADRRHVAFFLGALGLLLLATCGGC
jgi:hypothetical protein